MKTLIAFFSRKGSNFVGGGIKDLPIGNTEVAAGMVRKLTGGDLFKIDTVQPYPGDYTKTTEIAQQELNQKAPRNGPLKPRFGLSPGFGISLNLGNSQGFLERPGLPGGFLLFLLSPGKGTKTVSLRLGHTRDLLVVGLAHHQVVVGLYFLDLGVDSKHCVFLFAPTLDANRAWRASTR